jgi:hypothetical protein
VHALTEDENDHTKISFMRKYHMKIMLGDFSTKLEREDIFKPTTGIKNLHEIVNDNGIREVNFAS